MSEIRFTLEFRHFTYQYLGIRINARNFPIKENLHYHKKFHSSWVRALNREPQMTKNESTDYFLIDLKINPI